MTKPLDPGFAGLQSREKIFARLFLLAREAGEARIDLTTETLAKRMRMDLYAFRRKVAGEEAKKGLLTNLHAAACDLVIRLEGSEVVIADRAEAPEMGLLEAEMLKLEQQLTAKGINPYGFVAEKAPIKPKSEPLEAEVSPDFAESLRIIGQLKAEKTSPAEPTAPQAGSSNPYYTRGS